MAPQYDAVVVGAGFGGMGAAIELKRLGHHDLLILEREDDLGGTWHVNRYPGLAVDIPSSNLKRRFPSRTCQAWLDNAISSSSRRKSRRTPQRESTTDSCDRG